MSRNEGECRALSRGRVLNLASSTRLRVPDGDRFILDPEFDPVWQFSKK